MSEPINTGESKVESPASRVTRAEAFLAFDYVETKDLAKHFLTVVAAVLALSVTFSEKVVVFSSAPLSLRLLLVASWGLSLLSFILGGVSIFFMFNAGQRAKWITTLQHDFEYRKLARNAFDCLIIAGAAFVLSLLALVLVGVGKLF